MERHKLWEDRAGKLMERTFEKFGYGKKKDIKESLQDEERWTVEWFPATSDRRAIKKFHSGEEAMNFIKGENLLDAEDLAVYNPKGEEVDINQVQEAPRYGEEYADMDGDDDGGNSLLDYEDYNMLEKAIEGPVRELIAGGHTKEDLLDAFKIILGFENVNEDETENPEVDRAEDVARKAKIKALQVQLKALQKTQSME